MHKKLRIQDVFTRFERRASDDVRRLDVFCDKVVERQKLWKVDSFAVFLDRQTFLRSPVSSSRQIKDQVLGKLNEKFLQTVRCVTLKIYFKIVKKQKYIRHDKKKSSTIIDFRVSERAGVV